MKLENRFLPVINYMWKKINPIFNERTFANDAKKVSLIFTLLFEGILIMSLTHVWFILVFAISAFGFFYALHKLISNFLESDDE